MNNCKVFVVSLARATARREFMRTQLNSRGFNWEFFDATDGKGIALSDLQFRVHREFWHINRGRQMSPGEIGAFFSHYSLWQKIYIHRIPYALILEDDAFLPNGMEATIDSILSAKAKWDIVILHAKKPFRHTVVENLGGGGGGKLVRFHRRVGGAVAYLITAAAAEKLVSYCGEIHAPIDWMYAEWWRNGLEYLAVLPAPVGHGKHKSTIRVLPKTGRTIGEHFAALRYRIADRFLLRKMLREKQRRTKNEQQTFAR